MTASLRSLHTTNRLLDRRLAFVDSYSGSICQKESGPGPGTTIFRDGLITHMWAMSALAAVVLENSHLRSRLEALGPYVQSTQSVHLGGKKLKFKGVKNGR